MYFPDLRLSKSLIFIPSIHEVTSILLVVSSQYTLGTINLSSFLKFSFNSLAAAASNLKSISFFVSSSNISTAFDNLKNANSLSIELKKFAHHLKNLKSLNIAFSTLGRKTLIAITSFSNVNPLCTCDIEAAAIGTL